MGIGWLVFLLMVFWASKHGSTGEAKFFDPYEILQVLLTFITACTIHNYDIQQITWVVCTRNAA